VGFGGRCGPDDRFSHVVPCPDTIRDDRGIVSGTDSER
jgi:hypothetical protein